MTVSQTGTDFMNIKSVKRKEVCPLFTTSLLSSVCCATHRGTSHFSNSHREMRGAAMSLTAVSGGFVVLLTVTVIQGQSDWGVTYTHNHICGLKGSTVEMNCSYRYPYMINDHVTTVEETFWFTKWINNAAVDLNNDPDYTGRVEYHYKENFCSLRIRDLRQSDSAEYKFRFITNQGGKYLGSPGVTLSVTDLQVLVKRSSAQTELKCLSTPYLSDHRPYVWYKDGQKMKEETFSLRVSLNDDSSYSCALKGCEDHPSPPVYPPKLLSVSVSPSGEIVEGSSVNLTCSSDANPAANYTWYKENEDSPKASGQIFTITELRPGHSGNYYCEAQNTRGRRNSTLNLTVVTAAWKSAAAGTITAVLLALIVLAVFLWIRRDKCFTQQCERGERPDNRAQLNVGPVYDTPSAAAQRQAAEQQDDLQYATISFSHNHTDAVYSDVRVRPQRETEADEEEDRVEYTAVRLNDGSSAERTRRQEDGEDSLAVYSTVNKTST
ncbi:sialoadhesin-like isoform X2 [Trachinotus anak]|uniref:sialoadhesin-like isoform X2 n=1 Tax=Trachinotus anak TaxID=443729 RepID=UPI0039F22B35